MNTNNMFFEKNKKSVMWIPLLSVALGICCPVVKLTVRKSDITIMN